MKTEVADFLGSFCSWAGQRPDIEGVALVGSHARDTATEDSDVDLVILTLDLNVYLRDPSWLPLFGMVREYSEEDWGLVKSLRVLYESGLEVEFGFTTREWAKVPLDAGTVEVLSNRMKILYDPQTRLLKLQEEVSRQRNST